MMHGREKSDSVIVAVKSPNKTGEPAAEAMERRAATVIVAAQASNARAGHRAGKACHRRRSAYGRPQGFAVTIRGGSRMRESRTSGSGRGDQGNLVPYRHRATSPLISVIQARLTFQNSGPVNSNFPARLLR